MTSFRNLLASVLLAGQFVGLVHPNVLNAANDVDNTENTTLEDTIVNDALRNISLGRTKTNDDKLVSLIKSRIIEAATTAMTENPEEAIDIAGIKAQEFVSRITEAYSLAVFQATSPKEAQEIFSRYYNTVQQIVQFTRNGQFVV